MIDKAAFAKKLPKVKADHLPKYVWEPDDIVIHKKKGVGQKPVQSDQSKDPQSKQSPNAPKGGAK